MTPATAQPLLTESEYKAILHLPVLPPEYLPDHPQPGRPLIKGRRPLHNGDSRLARRRTPYGQPPKWAFQAMPATARKAATLPPPRQPIPSSYSGLSIWTRAGRWLSSCRLYCVNPTSQTRLSGQISRPPSPVQKPPGAEGRIPNAATKSHPYNMPSNHKQPTRTTGVSTRFQAPRTTKTQRSGEPR